MSARRGAARSKRRILASVAAAAGLGGLALVAAESPVIAGEGGTAAPADGAAAPAADPTDGWEQASFSHSMHKPWNLDLSERYRYDSGSKTHAMWVYSTDEPFEQGSGTDPRTEMRWSQEYTSGKHMWDADVYIPAGSDGADFMQILRAKHPAGTPATDIMMRIHNENGGTVKRYDSQVIKKGVYDTWWNLKVAHDADAGKIQVYADDELVLTADDRGPATRHFKNGVYHHGEGRAEARFRNIHYWVK
jgi:hypothetical protein